jgi:molybdenum cofactor biosynthesis enzyme MoaA
MITSVERTVHVKLDAKEKKVSYVHEDNKCERTYLEYLASGAEHPLDFEMQGDKYYDPEIPLYPGQKIGIMSNMAKKNYCSKVSRMKQQVAGTMKTVLGVKKAKVDKPVQATVLTTRVLTRNIYRFLLLSYMCVYQWFVIRDIVILI